MQKMFGIAKRVGMDSDDLMRKRSGRVLSKGGLHCNTFVIAPAVSEYFHLNVRYTSMNLNESDPKKCMKETRVNN